MKPRSAKAKGKLLEKWLAERLRHTGLDSMARPEIGSGSGKFKGDIATKLPLTFECKNTKNFQAMAYLRQAEEAGMGYQDAVVVWHPPQTSLEDSKVFINWDLFEKLIKAFFKEKVSAVLKV